MQCARCTVAFPALDLTLRSNINVGLRLFLYFARWFFHYFSANVAWSVFSLELLRMKLTTMYNYGSFNKRRKPNAILASHCICSTRATVTIADPGFLAASGANPQVTLVINPVVGCRYFPPGLLLLSQGKWSPIGQYQIILFGDRATRV